MDESLVVSSRSKPCEWFGNDEKETHSLWIFQIVRLTLRPEVSVYANVFDFELITFTLLSTSSTERSEKMNNIDHTSQYVCDEDGRNGTELGT